ncbi:alpha-glucan phosphorylase [Halothermothrix orenii H 168]|uniref:glycogen phosphorylase n=2 Tax=Halothermothrix orenii TaxID=31909 RepID=B8CZG3_HALOH|nr:alpha-glucan phosphorylase [Halothermothrix orenii H 168]
MQMPRIAFFCMEYGLESDFKIYAGGLGILAGDYLKAARDMGLPIVGIGLLWKQGYTRQVLNEKDYPVDTYPNYKYDFLEDTGIKIRVKIRNRDVYCRVWKVDNFDNAPLYLLDTDLDENEDRWITGQLYGYFEEERVAQEMVLGIGGIKALKALGIEVDVYHLNEGHAVFAALELIKEQMQKGLSFAEARELVKEKVVFTTHTPVKQGNEEHTYRRLDYMGAFDFFTPEQMGEIGGIPFNMTVAGLRLAGKANAVSSLHNITANNMWAHIDNRAEIIGITNGVHRPTWVSDKIVQNTSNPGGLWEVHKGLKQELIDFIHKRTGQKLDINKLLIGFARRAVPYKRGNLIFKNNDRIEPLLKEGKIQIIFSGKAHPLDDEGKEIIASQVGLARKYPGQVVFLEDYDMEIARYMTRGCDVWLNNPRKPMEACGTSGMKAAMNGVLNLSVLDGWWAEACRDGKNGWQFGDGMSADDFTGDLEARVIKQDRNDLTALYDVLYTRVLPTYYNNREEWLKMMERSIDSTYDRYSARRMLGDYYNLLYQ